ncbi:MAG: hypothetical protein CM15mP51_22650 [Porticoccaceae bacterium]|nr:MAG: hypothetical protein CM15mP51_22650 [Porticoccaceae bacterium]
MLVMWSFIGLETATVPADNIVEPEKTIPRVMIASVMTIMILTHGKYHNYVFGTR